jgi:hypothetical protein
VVIWLVAWSLSRFILAGHADFNPRLPTEEVLK